MTDEISGDQFAHFDGAYVLGALSESERFAFEEHLIGCADCRARVAEIADLPVLLALATEAAYSPAPDVEADPVVVLLSTIRTRRRRRRALTAAVAALVAACLVTFTAFIARDHTGPSGARPVAMAALTAAPIHATAQVTDLPWGTSIELRCTYDESSGYPRGKYTLTVVNRTGDLDMLGTWNVVPGKVTTFSAGTAFHVRDIKTITISTASGTQVLQLRY